MSAQKEYYERNKEFINEKRREKYKENRDQELAQKKRYYERKLQEKRKKEKEKRDKRLRDLGLL